MLNIPSRNKYVANVERWETTNVKGGYNEGNLEEVVDMEPR